MKVFNNIEIRQIWNKGLIVPGYNPDIIRQDVAGAWMCFTDYGKQTPYGWQIDHIYPASKGGSDRISNFQPLQWENNLAKGDATTGWNAAITSSGERNIRCTRFIAA